MKVASGDKNAQPLLENFYQVVFFLICSLLYVAGHSFASDYSGVWIGKTIPQDPECGFSESFKLAVYGDKFEAVSKDVIGSRSFSGKIDNGKIKESINWGCR